MKRSEGELCGHCIYPQWISVSTSSTGVYARAVHIQGVRMLYGNLTPRETEAFSTGIGKANILDPLLEPIPQMRHQELQTRDRPGSKQLSLHLVAFSFIHLTVAQ